MKKTIILLLLIMIVSPIANAAQIEQKNKIKADSIFYFLDKTEERVKLLFASDNKKAKLKLKYGYERLIEAKEMLEKDNSEKAKELLKEGINNFVEATKLATKDLVKDEEWQKIKSDFQSALAELKQELTKNNITKQIKEFFNFNSVE